MAERGLILNMNVEDKQRPGWKAYFLAFASQAASRSTCIRRHVGAVVVRDNQVLTVGYNGSPTGAKHCVDIGCIREQQNVPSGQQHEKCRGVHAEQNCITQAARIGVSLKGATLYSTTYPCSICAKLIAQAGIRKVIYLDGYDDPMTAEILGECDVELVKA